MRCVIIDYGSGNLRSAAKACERALKDFGIQGSIVVSSDAEDLKTATHIILPGVGAFADCMQGLKAVPGLLAGLEHEVLVEKKPFLGICVGMQLLFERGFEHGEHAGLGWLKGEVVKLTPDNPNLKIPHMGWNRLRDSVLTHPVYGSSNLTHPACGDSLLTHHACGGGKGGALSASTEPSVCAESPPHLPPPQAGGVRKDDAPYAYFVHSYHAKCADREDVVAVCDYGGEVVAMVQRGNIWGTQFHPEKSQETGLGLLAAFLRL